jgi:F-type H+-transporting ATPase subunit gamma
MALKDIKQKIQATNRMHKVTRAMEAVSAVKMRKSQLLAFASRPFAHTAVSILSNALSSGEHSAHSLLTGGSGENLALVVVTSDKGLAGALNSSVLKEALALASHYTKDKVIVYAVGKKAGDFFLRRGYTVAYNELNKLDEVSMTQMQTLSSALIEQFTTASLKEVKVVYSNFISTFEQRATSRTLLPVSLENAQKVLSDITPVKGKWSAKEKEMKKVTHQQEYATQTLLDALIPKIMSSMLYHMLLEGKASEHSARMVAMKNARDKSQSVSKDLNRLYNKIRQANITREVSEIVGGREALAT